MGVGRKKLVLPYEGSEQEWSVSQGVSQSCLCKQKCLDGQIVAQRDCCNQPFSHPDFRETPDKISEVENVTGTVDPLAYIKMSYFGYKCCNRPGEQQKAQTINQEEK